MLSSKICDPLYHQIPGHPCYVVSELQMHAMWLLKLTKSDLPALRSFSINVYLDSLTNCKCKPTLEKYQGILTSLEKAASIRVYSCVEKKSWLLDNEESYFDQNRSLEYEYSPEEGRLVWKGVGPGNVRVWTKRCVSVESEAAKAG